MSAHRSSCQRRGPPLPRVARAPRARRAARARAERRATLAAVRGRRVSAGARAPSAGGHAASAGHGRRVAERAVAPPRPHVLADVRLSREARKAGAGAAAQRATSVRTMTRVLVRRRRPSTAPSSRLGRRRALRRRRRRGRGGAWPPTGGCARISYGAPPSIRFVPSGAKGHERRVRAPRRRAMCAGARAARRAPPSARAACGAGGAARACDSRSRVVVRAVKVDARGRGLGTVLRARARERRAR